MGCDTVDLDLVTDQMQSVAYGRCCQKVAYVGWGDATVLQLPVCWLFGGQRERTGRQRPISIPVAHLGWHRKKTMKQQKRILEPHPGAGLLFPARPAVWRCR